MTHVTKSPPLRMSPAPGKWPSFCSNVPINKNRLSRDIDMFNKAIVFVIAILASAIVFAAEQAEPTVAKASYIVQADSYVVAK